MVVETSKGKNIETFEALDSARNVLNSIGTKQNAKQFHEVRNLASCIQFGPEELQNATFATEALRIQNHIWKKEETLLTDLARRNDIIYLKHDIMFQISVAGS